MPNMRVCTYTQLGIELEGIKKKAVARVNNYLLQLSV